MGGLVWMKMCRATVGTVTPTHGLSSMAGYLHYLKVMRDLSGGSGLLERGVQ